MKKRWAEAKKAGRPGDEFGHKIDWSDIGNRVARLRWGCRKIAGSIREFGFANPIPVDAEAGIIAGHASLSAALDLNLREVPSSGCVENRHKPSTMVMHFKDHAWGKPKVRLNYPIRFELKLRADWYEIPQQYSRLMLSFFIRA